MTTAPDSSRNHIQRQMLALAHALEQRHWPTLHTLFAPDISLQIGKGHPLQGKPLVITFIRTFLQRCGHSTHRLGDLSLTIIGNKAFCRATTEDHYLPHLRHEAASFQTWSTIEDQWILRDHHWTLLKRQQQLDHIHGTPLLFRLGMPQT